MGVSHSKLQQWQKKHKERQRKKKTGNNTKENVSTSNRTQKEELRNQNKKEVDSQLRTNVSKPERSSSGEDIVTELADSNLVVDGSLKVIVDAKCKPIPKPKCEHVEQEWTVNELVDSFSDFELVPADRRKKIVETAKTSALLAFPHYFYDFCLISSDVDYEDANSLKEQLCSKYDLTGCMLDDDDFNKLGRDMFQAFENMIKRSTKIFFYVTENFNANGFYMRVQNGAVFQSLISRATEKKEKCVPVFPNGLCEVPLALSGIGGLEIPHERITAQRIKITYTEKVRNQRLEQERINNEKRKDSFLHYLHFYVKQCLDECEKSPMDDALPNLDFLQSKVPQNVLDEDTSSTTSKLLNNVNRIIESSSSSPVVQSSEINVTSSSAHIGHNITVTINAYPPQLNNDQNSDSDGSDSD